MPKNKDLKRRVRSRMEKTGESYTAARAALASRTTRQAEPDLAALAGMSDAAVAKRTGRDWKAWVAVLDAIDATSLPHREIARWLGEHTELGGWWAQTVTVGYERIRGLRAKGQRRGGAFDVNKSKTLGVPIARLYAAFGARGRRAWLGEHDALRIRTARRDTSIRADWSDGTKVDVHFWTKGASKSQVQLQHRGHPTKAAADAARAFWTERFAALAEFLR